MPGEEESKFVILYFTININTHIHVLLVPQIARWVKITRPITDVQLIMVVASFVMVSY